MAAPTILSVHASLSLNFVERHKPHGPYGLNTESIPKLNIIANMIYDWGLQYLINGTLFCNHYILTVKSNASLDHFLTVQHIHIT